MVVNPRVLKRSFILLATILTLAACQDDPPPDDPPPPEPEPPRVETTIEEYAVKGDDCDEVRSALFPVAGSHPGKTICEPEIPAFGFSAGRMRPATACSLWAMWTQATPSEFGC